MNRIIQTLTWSNLAIALSSGLLLLVFAGPVAAETEHRLSAYVLGELWNDEQTPGHAALMLRWDLEGLPGDSRLGLEYNTDTLRLGLDGFKLNDATEFGVLVIGEAIGANLLFDYFQQGKSVPERAISASFIGAQAWLKVNLLTHLYVQAELGAKNWFFKARENKTSPNLILPADGLVVEPRLHFTWWKLAHDAVWAERMRLYPRHHGWALGATLGLNYQQKTKAWGALDKNEFSPTDLRNDPQELQYLVSQWMWAGWKIGSNFRTQVIEELAWSQGEDDLSRRTIGGLTPYTVNIPGVPWAYFHAGDYGALQWTTHIPLFADGLEIGSIVSAVAMRDVDRIASADFSTVWGVGGLLDWRLDNWQVNLRAGYSPALKALHSAQGAWSMLFSLGWGATL